MKTYKQNADFLYLGKVLLAWYRIHGRDLPFRKTNDPYKIWICEIIFQQTRIQQGLNHYNEFVKRFPDVQTLAAAETDDVLLHWKGLGYYSRALNLHKAAKQIITDFHGVFPGDYKDILSLSGVGPYTAAAVSSICFGQHLPAVDGNFYRVLSRVFADDFDVSSSQAFSYFSDLALRMMPPGQAGMFNQAMMDLGSEICKPRNPLCSACPLSKDCLALQLGRTTEFPVKTKKQLTKDLQMTYFFVRFEDHILIRQRKDDFIWKKLYEFPDAIPPDWEPFIVGGHTVYHKLTHRNLTIDFVEVVPESQTAFEEFARSGNYIITTVADCRQRSFPKPLETFLATNER